MNIKKKKVKKILTREANFLKKSVASIKLVASTSERLFCLCKPSRRNNCQPNLAYVSL